MVPLVTPSPTAGIPVMAHLGFTPQSEHQLGGYRVQGRGDAADELLAEARALQAAGAFAVVLEMVPAPVATRVTEALAIPTIGIGAGNGTDAQVLVWSDFAGLRSGKSPRFVKEYADLRGHAPGGCAGVCRRRRVGRLPRRRALVRVLSGGPPRLVVRVSRRARPRPRRAPPASTRGPRRPTAPSSCGPCRAPHCASASVA